MDACLELEKKRCHKVLLTDGSEVSFENCFMTIHPHGIAKILPQSVQSEDFRKRIGEFGETCGFFTVFCTLDPPVPEFHQELSSCFSTPDVEMILSGRHPEATATAVMLTWETASGGEQRQTLTAFETVFPEETREWENTVHRNRPPSYSAYKQAKAQGIIKKVLQVYPQFEGHLKLAETASMLTYRDYLSRSVPHTESARGWNSTICSAGFPYAIFMCSGRVRFCRGRWARCFRRSSSGANSSERRFTGKCRG